MNFRDQDDRNQAAGEYVLGTLDRVETEELEQELTRDPALAKAVYEWQDRLLAVMPPPAAVEPSPHLWTRIEHGLPPVKVSVKIQVSRATGLWASLAFWRWASVAGVAASTLLTWNLLTTAPQPRGPQPAGAQYVVVLQTPEQRPGWLVEADLSGGVRLTPLMRTVVAPDRALQFWTKPEGAAGPTSLGLVPADRPTLIPASRLPGLAPNQLFEVTMEPQAGSPLDRPTGPILAVGKAVKI